jgi:hypothetical protein
MECNEAVGTRREFHLQEQAVGLDCADLPGYDVHVFPQGDGIEFLEQHQLWVNLAATPSEVVLCW